MPTAVTVASWAAGNALVRPHQLSFLITMNDTICTQTNADLATTSGLNTGTFVGGGSGAGPNGYTTPADTNLLTTFLKGTYASNAAAEAAFRAMGGEVVVRQTGVTCTMIAGILVQWTAAGPSTPSLTYTITGGGSNETLEVIIRVPMSAVQ